MIIIQYKKKRPNNERNMMKIERFELTESSLAMLNSKFNNKNNHKNKKKQNTDFVTR